MGQALKAYYNEWDAYCAEWLRNLIAEGLLPDGDVDERDIREVQPSDLEGYDACHFFAGLGGWPYALRLAGWPDSRPVWTGSCPCQPFSAAGKGQASSDERHLWPAWFELIKTTRPAIIFGEQVEAAIGWAWLDLVYSDLEKEGYTVGAAVLPACSVGAPHIRQRLWFVANAEGCNGEISISERRQDQALPQSRGSSRVGELADATHNGQSRQQGTWSGRARATHGFWDDLTWLPCTDGKQRPTGIMADSISEGRSGSDRSQGQGVRNAVERRCSADGQRPTQPGIFPLAHGIPARVSKLRAIGNAIVPQVAAEFIKAATGD